MSRIGQFPVVLMAAFFTTAFAAVGLADADKPAARHPSGTTEPQVAQSGVEEDAIANDLATARIKYEEKIEKLREYVLAKLEDEETKLRNRGADLDKIEAVMVERNTFNTTGEWPSLHAIDGRRSVNERHRKSLDNAYEKARKAYIKTKEDERSRTVTSEFEALDKEDDVVPWGVNQVSGLDEAARVIGVDKKAFDAKSLGEHNYRIEVRATQLEGDEPLSVIFPVPGGQQVEVSAHPDKEGDVRLLLSVRESLVSADLGVRRPIAAPVDDGEPEKLFFASAKGKYRIDSVRFKPIVARRYLKPIPKAQSANKVPAGGKRKRLPRVAPSARLVKGSKWSGTFYKPNRSRPVTIGCYRRNGNDVIIGTPRYSGDGGLRFYFRIKGNKLALKDVEPVGHPGMVLKGGVSGAGIVQGDRLRFEYRFVIQERGKPNRSGFPVAGGFNVTRID